MFMFMHLSSSIYSFIVRFIPNFVVLCMPSAWQHFVSEYSLLHLGHRTARSLCEVAQQTLSLLEATTHHGERPGLFLQLLLQLLLTSCKAHLQIL